MSKHLIVRYRTRPEASEDNSRLIEAVFASLAEAKPDGLAYTSYRLADGVSFVHVARLDGPENPLAGLAAFADFQRDLPGRCVEQPIAQGAVVIGAYRPDAPGAAGS
jgi:hypothetical protein